MSIEGADAIAVAPFPAFDWVDIEILHSVEGQLKDVYAIFDNVGA